MNSFKEVFESIYGPRSFNDDFTISAKAAENVFIKTLQARHAPVFVAELSNKYTWAPALTWDKIKEFANTLNPDQLARKAIVWGDERGVEIQEVGELEEDYYVDDEGSTPVSCFEPDPQDPEHILENYPIIPKGTPRFYTDVFEEVETWPGKEEITDGAPANANNATVKGVTFGQWKALLIEVATNNTTQDFAINEAEALKYYQDGFTPWQTFRETWSNENDSE
jgi:hypothetical protein